MGGYVTAGSWHGYAWTAKDTLGSTINPVDFSMLSGGEALCACGTVKGTSTYEGVAMIGINLSQEQTGDPVAVTPSGAGITVSVSGAGSTPLRLQIQGPDGETDPSQRWCANLPSTGGTVAWEDFQFECWDGGMQIPFDKTANDIVAAMVLVPGGTMDIPFDFCVTDLSGG